MAVQDGVVKVSSIFVAQELEMRFPIAIRIAEDAATRKAKPTTLPHSGSQHPVTFGTQNEEKRSPFNRTDHHGLVDKLPDSGELVR